MCGESRLESYLILTTSFTTVEKKNGQKAHCYSKGHKHICKYYKVAADSAS